MTSTNPTTLVGAPATQPTPTQRVQTSLARQGMMRAWGVRLERADVGMCELYMPFSDAVSQQQGSFHGGAMGALADIAGGYAALTVAPPGCEVMTAEYKINFLAAKSGGQLRAVGTVVRAGKRLIVATAEVTHVADDGTRTVCALMQQTLVAVAKRY